MDNLEEFSSTCSHAFRRSGLSTELISAFQAFIYGQYEAAGRRLPWRQTDDPYAIVVSEIMLQQTQVERVLTKYGPFLERFGGFKALAGAPLQEILTAWQGLGYNRRAKALQGLAQRVAGEFGGRLPADRAVLESLPGIGPATAGALLAFAFQQPAVFLETNIRRVYLHFFYPEAEGVPDRCLAPLVLLTMDARRVRPWYYALMDVGAALKRLVPNPNRRSAHYTRQSPFPGSDREIRSKIIKLFLGGAELTARTVAAAIPAEASRVQRILGQLAAEGFVAEEAGRFRLASGLEPSG